MAKESKETNGIATSPGFAVRVGDVVMFRVPQYQAEPLVRAAHVAHVYQSTDPYPVIDLQIIARPTDGHMLHSSVACDPEGKLPGTWSPR